MNALTASTDTAVEAEISARRVGAVLAVACASTFVAFLDVAVVNLAFPSLMAAFPQTTQSTLTWTISGYAVAFAACLAAGGRLADTLGHRLLLLAGVLGFGLASAACTLAPGVGWLIAARVVQGAAGAAMLPAALGAMLRAAGPARTAAAVGAWSAAAAAATALGPAVGAVLIDTYGWRAIFAVNLPVCAVLAVLAALALPASTPSSREHTSLPDGLGVLLLSGGLAAVVAAITQGHQWHYSSPMTWGLGGAGILALGAAAWRGAHHPQPALPVRLWNNRGFAAATAVNALLGLCLFGYMLAAPMWLISIWREPLLTTAFAVGSTGIAATVGALIVGRFASAITARWFVAIGMGGVACEFAAIACGVLPAEQSWTRWALLSAGIGLGIGAATSALSIVVAATVPTEESASGIGLATTARQIGGAIGVAALAAVLSTADGDQAVFSTSFHHLFALLAAVAAAAIAVAAAVLCAERP
ncbi:MFS transporter [Nocardia niigatensis]